MLKFEEKKGGEKRRKGKERRENNIRDLNEKETLESS
jgi:hypothetical protein